MRWRSITKPGWRIWQNYLMPSKLEVVANWFRLSQEHGYQFYSVENYWRATDAGRRPPPPKSIVLRHDIDVDIDAARAMFAVEKKLKITGSYYFRLSTLDLPLMRTITDAGGEASYHYEELATEAKASCLRSVDEVGAKLPLIRQRFRENLERLRATIGLPMATVASHGDWVNRALQMTNIPILESAELRKDCGIEVEAYDYELLKFVSARYADAPRPAWWVGRRVNDAGTGRVEFRDGAPRTPDEAVRESLPVIYVLLHPEQWRRGPRWHFREQQKRLREAAAYRFCIPTHTGRLLAPHAQLGR